MRKTVICSQSWYRVGPSDFAESDRWRSAANAAAATSEVMRRLGSRQWGDSTEEELQVNEMKDDSAMLQVR